MFELDDLMLAYRKAKVDLYYSSNSRMFEVLEYERDLERRLQSLLDNINSNESGWVSEDSFVGGVSVVPKSLRLPEDPSNKVINSSPMASWKNSLNQNRSADRMAEFRLFSKCSIDMHVLSALWVGVVGSSFDNLLSESARGNRLRRNKSGNYNWLSLGSFEPYLHPYKSWRDDGLKAMESALVEGKDVVALTADATSFYHNINPEFIADESFLKEILRIESLTEEQLRLNALMLESIKSWRTQQTKSLGVEITGLPIGLSASSIIANLAMKSFDEIITTRVRPKYYGRYVDDIILVFDNVQEFDSPSHAFDWISNHFPEGSFCASGQKDESFIYKPTLLEGTYVEFGNEKNRLFNLSEHSGLDLLASLRASINERSSEWRAMPQLPEENAAIGALVARARRANGDSADSLRVTEKISTSRSAFALTLRDFEAFARDLPAAEWKIQRRAFLKAVGEHIFVPQGIFEMDQYITRILRIALNGRDETEFENLVGSLVGSYVAVLENCKVDLVGANAILGEKPILRIKTGWALHIREQIEWAIRATEAGSAGDFEKIEKHLTKLGKHRMLGGVRKNDLTKLSYSDLVEHDLAERPFRMEIFPKTFRPYAFSKDRLDSTFGTGRPIPVPGELKDPLSVFSIALNEMSRNKDESVDFERHPAVVYPTRPFSAPELMAFKHVLTPKSPGDPVGGFAQWCLATRGHTLDGELIRGMAKGAESGNPPVVTLTNKRYGYGAAGQDEDTRFSGTTRVAITMFETSKSSVNAALHGEPALTSKRYSALASVVRMTLALERKPDYLVLGELAIPAPWFFVAAGKLAARGISLISGIDYFRDGENSVRNQVWASLVHTTLGFKSAAIYRQDKQKPAHSERRNLTAQQGLILKPEIPWDVPPLINHGDHWFGILICSELTNIDYRSSFRGKVDTLFVSEWNRDLRTFEALVESSALDLHSYIVQVNNRTYGDSRVRAPMGDEWARDQARLRGGNNDYVVSVEIDYGDLRQFQSQDSSESHKYKPLPDGFIISSARRSIPKS